jgi:hypothetical protein
MTEQFANNAQTTLSAAIETTDGTSISVTSASGFPDSAQYRILIDDEIMIVTAGAGTTTWTVTRGAESTSGATHDNGATVTHVLTAGALLALQDEVTPDASAVTYTPAVAADWDGDTDPGNADDALDQLAERVDDLEATVTRGLAFYLHGEMAVETRAMAIIAPMALTVLHVRCVVESAPTGADLILDVNKNGTTLFTTQGNRPTIAATETSDVSAAPDVTAIAQGDVISIDVDQIGSSDPGENLTVTVVCEVA